jgi:hypothetical protein
VKRRQRGHRGAAALLAAVFVLGACGASTTTEEASDDTGDGSETTSETDATDTGDGTESGSDTGEATEDGPGVSADQVKMGFIITDLDAVSKALDFEVPDQGDEEAQIQAIAEYVNANGGIGGRDLVPVVKVFNAIQDTPSNEEELCLGLTEDDKVFAVAMTGQFQENARPCYAERDTLMLDYTLYPLDDESIGELAPYLWQPGLPSYGDTIAGMADAMASTEFLDGATLGVVSIDSDQNRRVYDGSLIPTLTDLGVEVADTQWIDPTDTSTLQAGQDQAVLSFKSNGVDRVLVLGGSRLAAFMIETGLGQNYTPVYALSTFDNPEFAILNYPDSIDGTVGVSLSPGWDVADDQYPMPANDIEETCLDLLAEAGHTFETRANARSALGYCDAALLLQAGAGQVDGSLNATAWSDTVGGMDDTMQLSSPYATTFAPGDFFGASGYHVFTYNPECACMELQGETVEF